MSRAVKRQVARAAGAGLLVLALAGCSMAPKYARPTAPVPEAWPQGEAYGAQDSALPAVASFRDHFRDPRLQTLIEQAIASNRDLRVAAANLAAARAQVRVQRAQQFPEIAVNASASRDSGAGEPASENYALQGGISAFEIDLFGRLASATEAERQRALASESAARTVRLGLVSDLASAWAVHAADAELLRIAEDTAASARRSVSLTQALLQGGVAPRIDLRQAEQILAVAEADVAAQKTALAQDRNLIQLLIGAPIDAALLSNRLEDAADSFAAPQAGLNSAVLLRRPDVDAAERQLRAANAQIGVARAQLFPQISLTGLLGLASGALGSLFDSDAFHTTLGGSARQAIFSGGGVRAGVAVSEAQRDAALAAYEKAIQTAFREVADALARRGTIADELRATGANAAAAADVARLTEARYRGGVASSLDNLDAQRSQYAARRREVAMRLVDVQNRVALYRVLGGDIATVVE